MKHWLDLRENPGSVFSIQIVDREGDVMKISGGLRLEKKLIDDIICKVAEEVESHNVGLTMFATKKGRKYQEDLLKMVHVRAIEKAVASTIKELKQQTTKQYIEKADAVKE